MRADLLIAALCSFAFGGISDLVFGAARRSTATVPYVASMAGSACLLALGIDAFRSRPTTFDLGSLLGVGTTSMRVGHLAAIFLTLLFAIGVATSACNVSWSRRTARVASRGLGAGYCLLLASVATVIVAGDAFSFLFAWESLALSFFVLSSSGRRSESQATASWMTLGFAKLGGASLLIGFLLLAGASGHFTIAQWHYVRSADIRDVAWVLVVIGFGTKLGLAPFQGWMPRGYTAAPPAARAAMAGIGANVGVYGLWRFLSVLGSPPVWLAVSVMLAGGITALVGIAFAGVQPRLSGVIAYSSVENGGIIIAAYGIALGGAAAHSPELEAVGLLAASLHVVAHALAKSTLFSSAQGIEEAAGSDELDELSGAGRALPLTGAAFSAGALALAGLPPTVGFVSEWFIFEALMQQFRLQGLALRLGMAGAGALIALTSGLAALTFVRLLGLTILSKRSPKLAGASVRRSGLAGRAGLSALGLSCLAVAAVTPLEIRLLADGLSGLVPASITRRALASAWVLQPVYSHFSILSPSWLWVAMPLAFSVVLVMATLASSGRYLRPRRVRAWRSAGPGVSGPTAYDPDTFANPLRHVLANVLGARYEVVMIERSDAAEPARHLGEPDGLERSTLREEPDDPARLDERPGGGSARIEYRSSVVEPVETYVYRPGVRIGLLASRAVRRLQSGRLDAYVAYMFVTLLLLLVVVATVH